MYIYIHIHACYSTHIGLCCRETQKERERERGGERERAN